MCKGIVEQGPFRQVQEITYGKAKGEDKPGRRLEGQKEGGKVKGRRGITKGQTLMLQEKSEIRKSRTHFTRVCPGSHCSSRMLVGSSIPSSNSLLCIGSKISPLPLAHPLPQAWTILQ